MALGIISVLAGLLVVFVIAPLLAADQPNEGLVPVDVTPEADLKRRRLVIYENLQDLEFEYKAGKIAPQDYEALRTSYRTDAAALMAASAEAGAPQDEDALIEREVAARRALRRQAEVPDYTCPRCGFENPLPVKFCGECGAPLEGSKSKRRNAT